MRPIRPVVEAITSAPVEVLNTHYHFDHIGGNHEFDEIAIHEIGAPLIEEDVPRELLEDYVTYATRQLEAADACRDADREFFWLLTEESEPRPFPSGFDPAAWEIRPTKASRTVSDGDQVELERRVLTVLHAPGHSPDGICLLDERNGLLFGADTINRGPIYAHFPDSDIEELARSANRLADVADDIRFVCVHHYGRVIADRSFLREIAAGASAVAAGEALTVRARDVLGGACLEARFDQFSITIPDPEAPPTVLTATG